MQQTLIWAAKPEITPLKESSITKQRVGETSSASATLRYTAG